MQEPTDLYRFQFYIAALVVASLLVPFNDPGLLTVFNSPFTIAPQNSGLNATPSTMNTVIFLAILSAGNSCIYGALRSLAALGAQKQAPAILAYINRSGTPVEAILFSSVCSLLTYFKVADPPTASIMIVYMVAICGRATLFSWMSICLYHVLFRCAWRVQGHDLEETPHKSPPSPSRNRSISHWSSLRQRPISTGTRDLHSRVPGSR
jgi:amino acid transporter